MLTVSTKNLLTEKLKIKTTIINITPPIPYQINNYFNEQLSTKIKNHLYTKTIVFVQNKTKKTIVFYNLINISPNISNNIRSSTKKEHKIPANNISIITTHSHTEPLYFGTLQKHFHNQHINKNKNNPHKKINYPKQLITQLINSIKKTHTNVQPTHLHTKITKKKKLSFNHQFHIKKKKIRFNPKQQNPNILHVTNPIDPKVNIISFSHMNKPNPFTTLITFTLHLNTIKNTKYSTNYPKHLQNQLQKKNNKQFVSFFETNTYNNINHINIKIKNRQTTKKIKSLLTNTISSKFPTLEPINHPTLTIMNTHFTTPLQSFSQQKTNLTINNIQ